MSVTPKAVPEGTFAADISVRLLGLKRIRPIWFSERKKVSPVDPSAATGFVNGR